MACCALSYPSRGGGAVCAGWWYCIILYFRLGSGSLHLRTAARGSHRARAGLSAIYACIFIICLCVCAYLDGGRPIWRHSRGCPQRLTRPEPHRDPIKSSHDLIEPMASFLAVRVSEGASDTHMPSGKMSRQRSRNYLSGFSRMRSPGQVI